MPDANTTAIAQQVWDALTPDERSLVRLGMFPADKMGPTKGLSYDDDHAVTCKLMALAGAK